MAPLIYNKEEFIMKSETLQKGRCVIVRILEDVNLNTDLNSLLTVVERSIVAGNKHIAFSFGEGSFLYTRHIATLVKCFEKLRDSGGTLAVIHPNRDIIDILALIDPEQMIIKADSEEELDTICAQK
jgi:hypothetical protein